MEYVKEITDAKAIHDYCLTENPNMNHKTEENDL